MPHKGQGKPVIALIKQIDCSCSIEFLLFFNHKTKGIVSVTKAPMKLKALFLIINIFFISEKLKYYLLISSSIRLPESSIETRIVEFFLAFEYFIYHTIPQKQVNNVKIKCIVLLIFSPSLFKTAVRLSEFLSTTM
jgi:hypothetical protein